MSITDISQVASDFATVGGLVIAIATLYITRKK